MHIFTAEPIGNAGDIENNPAILRAALRAAASQVVDAEREALEVRQKALAMAERVERLMETLSAIAVAAIAALRNYDMDTARTLLQEQLEVTAGCDLRRLN